MPRTTIPLKPVDSSQLKEIGYDAATKRLAIRFQGKSGAKTVYEYTNVPQLHFDGLQAASADPEGSVGRYFGEHIKGKADLYPFTKLVDDEADQPAAA